MDESQLLFYELKGLIFHIILYQKKFIVFNKIDNKFV